MDVYYNQATEKWLRSNDERTVSQYQVAALVTAPKIVIDSVEIAQIITVILWNKQLLIMAVALIIMNHILANMVCQTVWMT
nr:unnamed protein product [Callosobruchus analis]